MELHLGDCLEVMKQLDDNSVDLLFADLPYAQTTCKWDVLIDMEQFWEQANRVCKDTAPMFFTCSAKFGNTLINSNPKNFRYDLVWVKSNSVGFLNARKMPMRKHELVYVFYNKIPKIYTENISLYHKHKFRDNMNTKLVEGKSLYGTQNKKVRYLNEDGTIQKEMNLQRYTPPLPNSVIEEQPKYSQKQKHNQYGGKTQIHSYGQTAYDPPLPHSILEVNSQQGKHATQKPVALMEWVLKYYSRENDVVLDPTMGSGSTGEACKNMNRNFIGIEKDEDIYNVAFKRLLE
jgi:DNA modification methylase